MSLVKLRSMRASGEISTEEYELAKKLLEEETAKPRQGIVQRLKSDKATTPKWQLWATLLVALTVLGHVTSKREESVQPSGKILDLTQLGSNDLLDVSEYGPGFRVSRDEYGERWPYYRFKSAIVRCFVDSKTGRPMVTVQYDGGGVVYGLNGAAMGAGGFPDPRPFVVRDEYGHIKAQVPSEWISRGLQQCDR